MNYFIPNPPTFSHALEEQCRSRGDFRPILFEWYKYVGLFCNIIASISIESSSIRIIPQQYYAALTGLLNRCSRLMLSNTFLSSTRKYGETTRIIDRCISESAIIVQWLCESEDKDNFLRYIADGLRKDLILKKQIEKNILNRNGKRLIIETRMLKSINKCLDLSCFSEQEILNASRLPDLASMLISLNSPDIFYTAIQRMGSHAIHGTWSELTFNYLKHDGKSFHLRDHEIETNDAQYITIIRLVLAAMNSFLNFIIPNTVLIQDILEKIEKTNQIMIEIQNNSWNKDFQELK